MTRLLITALLLIGLLAGLYLIKTPVVFKPKASSPQIMVEPKVVRVGETYQIGWINGSKDQVDTIRVTSSSGSSTIFTTNCDVTSDDLPPRPAGRCSFKAYKSIETSLEDETFKIELIDGFGQVLASAELKVIYME